MFHLAKVAMAEMKHGSAVINTASVHADNPDPLLLVYATTKGSILNFPAGLAQMLAENGLRTNAHQGRSGLTYSVDNAGRVGEEFRQTGPDAEQISRRNL